MDGGEGGRVGGWRASAGARRQVGRRCRRGWGVPPRCGLDATPVRVVLHGGAGAAAWSSTRAGGARGAEGAARPGGRAGGARPCAHSGACRGGGGWGPPAALDGDDNRRRGAGSGGTPPRRTTGGGAPARGTACGTREVKEGGDAGHGGWRAASGRQDAPSVGRGGAARRRQPYGKNRAENRHLLKETGILDSLFRFFGTRWGSTVMLTVMVSRTHHFADSKPDQIRSVKITRPESQFFDSASSQRVSFSTSHVRSIASTSGAGAR